MDINHSSSFLTIPTNCIHLWTINPQQISSAQVSALQQFLSIDEIEKVNRYRVPKSRHNALITRAFIRLLLSQYAMLRPQDWKFTISVNGKPELTTPPLPLRFNLSHNNELIICALCLDYDIGCDVENIQREINIEGISRRYFSTAEQQDITSLPAILQRRRFFEYWTLKEAFVKATGYGISLGLDSFSYAIMSNKKETMNDDIKLVIRANDKISDNDHWYNCLTYPDEKHCIAISVNTGKETTAFSIQHFSADDLIYRIVN